MFKKKKKQGSSCTWPVTLTSFPLWLFLTASDIWWERNQGNLGIEKRRIDCFPTEHTWSLFSSLYWSSPSSSLFCPPAMSSWAFRTRKTTFTNCNNETLVTTLRCKCIATLYYTKPYLFRFDSLTFKCFAPLYYHSVRKACVWACMLPHLPLPPGTGHPVCPLAGLDFQLSECTQITEQVKTGYKVYFSSQILQFLSLNIYLY